MWLPAKLRGWGVTDGGLTVVRMGGQGSGWGEGAAEQVLHVFVARGAAGTAIDEGGGGKSAAATGWEVGLVVDWLVRFWRGMGLLR